MTENLRIIGDTTISGGRFNDVYILGQCVSTGDMFCRGLNVVGEMRVGGELESGNMKIAGVLKVSGSCAGKSANIMGDVNVAKSFSGSDVWLAGRLGVADSCEMDSITVRGVLKVSGVLRTERANFQSAHFSTVKEMGGRELIVKKPFWSVFTHSEFVLQSDLAVFEEVDVDYVDMGVLRGGNIRIGCHSKIDRVEYRGDLYIEPGAKVGERVNIH